MYRKILTAATIVLSALTMMAMAPEQSTSQRNFSIGMSAHTGGHVRPRYSASNPPPFSRADINGDGLIERNEATAIGIPFATLDVNGDGRVTRSEYSITTAHYAHRSAIKLN
jgi:hypothetical protein